MSSYGSTTGIVALKYGNATTLFSTTAAVTYLSAEASLQPGMVEKTSNSRSTAGIVALTYGNATTWLPTTAEVTHFSDEAQL